MFTTYKQIPVHKSCFINLLTCCFVPIGFENSEFVKNSLFQGGPGSTSMYGLLKENGPYLVEAKYLPFGDPHLVKNHYRLFWMRLILSVKPKYDSSCSNCSKIKERLRRAQFWINFKWAWMIFFLQLLFFLYSNLKGKHLYNYRLLKSW